MNFAIRDLTKYEEFTQVIQVQQKIWGLNNSEGLYAPMLKTIAENGGTVIAAFDADKMIGFVVGFLGRHTDGRIKLCSQTLGVLPEYRNQGVAATLKWTQRQQMRLTEIDLITWTYDPIEAPNARLNIRTLGGVARIYKEDVFGENFSALTQGLATDRFVVEWWIKSDRVEQRSKGIAEPIGLSSPIVNRCVGSSGDRRIETIDLNSDSPWIRVEIPNDLQSIKKTNLALAKDWRLKMREVSGVYFARGYQVIDFVRAGEVWGPTRASHNWYVLQRGGE
ncbi:MAG TPA: GNAT family N-acetyltransferase [Anaerolineae bacterium]|nr:GNAT family N-acetyltransferase [Anaerolineae bacterium]